MPGDLAGSAIIRRFGWLRHYDDRSYRRNFLARREGQWTFGCQDRGYILAGRQADPDTMGSAFSFVIFAQSLPQAVGFHPDDGVAFPIEISRTPSASTAILYPFTWSDWPSKYVVQT